MLGLGGGLPADELFPRAAITEAFLRVIRAPSCPALQYGWPEGDAVLRSWIAARLRGRGVAIQADDVIVTNGAQQALAVAADLLLGDGDRVGVDPETYPAALDLFRSRGAQPVAGFEGIACVYAMAGVANPRGNGLPASRRAQLLGSSFPVLVDEAYAELRFDGVVDPPLLGDARDRVWHVGTFSKTLCPGFRVGWLVPPPRDLKRALRMKHDRDLQAGSLAQQVLRAFLTDDDFDARLSRSRTFYEARAERLSRALRRRFPSWRFRDPIGGFSLFVETDLEGDDARLLALATRHGVSFDPGRLFRPAGRSSPIALRLCYSAVHPSLLDEAVKRLQVAARAFERGGA